MWTLLKLKNSGEILSLKTFGLSSTKFVYLLGIASFFVISILIAFQSNYFSNGQILRGHKRKL